MLKSSSYFDLTLPEWFNFEPILGAAFEVAEKIDHSAIHAWKPQNESGVNYQFLSNKDGKFAWRPFELINPLIYAKAVQLITHESNWSLIQQRLALFSGGVVECCSLPVVSNGPMSDVAEQILQWWHKIEQRSLELSFEYSHVAISDVSNCYPSIYTHAIAWAFHDKGFIKNGNNRNDPNLIGNRLDKLIRCSREGQTNGLPQASILSHVLAELILGYCDREINKRLAAFKDVRILRYRDDYRIFGLSDSSCNEALKVVSEELHEFGMRLGAAKTTESTNLVSSAVKSEKIVALGLITSQTTLQKELLILHKFALDHPNAGSLKVLLKNFLKQLKAQIFKERYKFENKTVLVAILMDIVAISPNVVPAVARAVSLILEHLPDDESNELFERLLAKSRRIPNSGYLDIWLQRMALPSKIQFDTTEALCLAATEQAAGVWNFDWISDTGIKEKLTNFSVVDHTLVEAAKPEIPEAEIDDFWKDSPSF